MKIVYKIAQYVAEQPPKMEVTKSGRVKLTLRMPKMAGYSLKVDLWNLAAAYALMEGWKEGVVYEFEGEFTFRQWDDNDYIRCAATVNLTAWTVGGDKQNVNKYDEVWREAEVLKYVLDNWRNKQLVVAKGPKKLVGGQLMNALHAMGVAKEKRLRVDEEDSEQDQAEKRARVAPEVLSRIIDGLNIEDADKAMNE